MPGYALDEATGGQESTTTIAMHSYTQQALKQSNKVTVGRGRHSLGAGYTASLI